MLFFLFLNLVNLISSDSYDQDGLVAPDSKLQTETVARVMHKGEWLA